MRENEKLSKNKSSDVKVYWVGGCGGYSLSLLSSTLLANSNHGGSASFGIYGYPRGLAANNTHSIPKPGCSTSQYFHAKPAKFL